MSLKLTDLLNRRLLVSEEIIVGDGRLTPSKMQVAEIELCLPNCKLCGGKVVFRRVRYEAVVDDYEPAIRQVGLPQVDEDMLVGQGKSELMGVD